MHRYAIVGTGGRSTMFRQAIRNTYRSSCKLVALCETNEIRARNWASDMDGAKPPIYAPDDFLKMIQKEKVQTVVVTTIDRCHHRYIVDAMKAGCDVISEKPMTTDAEKCRQILEAQRETGRRLTITFNYRYAPRNSRVKEVLLSGAIGEVLSVHFEWLLDTKHGADYFRRWHRDKRNSGGLMVHKATHHFDLVNWWLDTIPEEVCAFGGLRFYGRENQERHGFGERYVHATGSPAAKNDPWAIHLDDGAKLEKLYLEPSVVDGYRRDQNVFGDGISIEDDMAVLVRYRNGATMTYHLTAYSPFEGYRVMFNGTKGRLEFEVVEKSYTSASETDHNFATNVLGGVDDKISEPTRLILRPHWSKPARLSIETSGEGGHGGADKRMLEEIFGKPSQEADPLHRAAGHVAGAYSILTGIAANASMAERRIIRISEFGLDELLD